MQNSSTKTRRGSPSPSRLPLPPDSKPATPLPQSDAHAVPFESAAGFPAAPTTASPPSWPNSTRPTADPGSPPGFPPAVDSLRSETCAVTTPIAAPDAVASPVVVVPPPDEEHLVISAPTPPLRGPPSPAKPLETAMIPPASTRPTEKNKRTQRSARKGSSPGGTEINMPDTAAATVGSPPHATERPSASPVEPEQHVSGDAVESIIRKMKGTRPELLRTSTYYEGAKV